MKKYFYIIFLFSITHVISAQQGTQFSFDKITNLLKSEWFISERVEDSLSKYSIEDNDGFSISISKNPINFEIDSLILKNPFYDEELDYDERDKNFPVSYSVIYDDKLISLFDNGKFVCHNLDYFSRDEEYERKLNVKEFRQHWIVNDRLYAQSKNGVESLFEWDGNKWIRPNIKLPVNEQPILFDDEEFIVFNDCHGEWGGTVYFYDKSTENIYFTESTCANSVIKKDGKYLVLAHLGHMSGSTEIKSIPDPRQLTKANKKDIGRRIDGEALGYKDKTQAYEKLIDYYDIQLFSTFNYNERQLFVSRLNYFQNATFLAEIKENEIQIVHPLFDNDKYTHDPITRSYCDYTLMGLDHYGTGFNNEVSVIIIKGDKITLIDWNEHHAN